MNQIRNILSFLLIAGTACVQAQQPIVKINGGSPTGCDVTAAAGAPIFQLDATGNVLVNGTLNGQGCGTAGGGGGGTPNFGLTPPASGVVINGGAASVAAGSVATVPLTYQAYNASGNCTVGTPTTTGTCPAITASNGGCTATGSQFSCAPSGATLSIPTVAQMGANTSCAYTAKATCLPGSVVSSAVLTVTTAGSGDVPPECASLATIHNSAGAAWTRLTTGTSVMYGDNTTATRDPTDYVSVWSYGAAQTPWPGETSTIRPTILPNLYVALKFVTPSDTSLAPKWSWTGSGLNSNFAATISKCPGDFGQTGTQLTAGCKLNQSQSSNGLTVHVNPVQQGVACTVIPGNTYYLNVLPNASLPVSNVSTSSPTCSPKCTPYIVRNP